MNICYDNMIFNYYYSSIYNRYSEYSYMKIYIIKL